jgi:hypothetical protein
MEFGPAPAATVGVLMGVRLPKGPMTYCDTLALPLFAT